MRTFVYTKNGLAQIIRTYAIGPGLRTITPDIEGKIEEVVPAPYAKDILAKWPPEKRKGVTTVREIDDKDVPDLKHKTRNYYAFKAAWVDTGAEIAVDMPKARVIQMARIREARDKHPDWAKIDADRNRALEARDGVLLGTVQKAAQALRNLPDTIKPKINKAKTPKELEAAWPDNLPRP